MMDDGKTHLFLFLELRRLLLSLLLLALAFLEQSLGNENLVLGGNGPIRLEQPS